MKRGRSDASTSTDDITTRPLCLFYFTHPFGVLSPEPPSVTVAPPHVARTFINMEPVSPFHLWASTSQDSYNTATTSSDPKPNYDLGNTTVYKKPLDLVSVPKTRNFTLNVDLRRDSLSSSLYSGEFWMDSSSSSKSYDHARRLIPYNRILPPLQLPVARMLSPSDSSDDVWPKKYMNPEKFSLPPIEMSVSKRKVSIGSKCKLNAEMSTMDTEEARQARSRRVVGVRKRGRGRRSGVRRTLTHLIQRTIKGHKECSSSPALQEVLNIIREAWTEPRSLQDRCRAVTRSSNAYEPKHAIERDGGAVEADDAMPMQAQHGDMSPRPGASPGLLRRRYSVPETIMRKYRLAQQQSESEERVPGSSASVMSASPVRSSCGSLCESTHRFARRDRELMRKSALLRRLWGRPCARPDRACCCCSTELDAPPRCTRETRSLDGSRSELRHLSPPLLAPVGWTTPKRQRLDSPHEHHTADDMLRAAMRNSYERYEESRVDRRTRTELSDSTYRSHGRGTPYAETSSDSILDGRAPKSFGRSEGDVFLKYERLSLSEAMAVPLGSSDTNREPLHSDDRSLTYTSDKFSASIRTAKETDGSLKSKISRQTSTSEHIDGRVSERSVSIENNDNNELRYDTPVIIETPSYEILEIVVSETANTNPMPAIKHELVERASPQTAKPLMNNKKMKNIDLDEYVSNILVESLNSLTDQLESMNASIASDRKISIVEKEIKVKLQNTGVNTVVHLSPTSNNQIIFGNEELYIKDYERKNECNNLADARDISVSICDEPRTEFNNNLTSAESTHDQKCEREVSNNVFNIIPHDNVNRAVLQQIQKLFQDELHNLDPEKNQTVDRAMPSISHIEISNVDVYLDSNADAQLGTAETIEMQTQRNMNNVNAISGIGTGNYFRDANETTIVPRFTAFPHTDSMEVNTSSSDDAELVGSDCTSLVDSLDDPNSPRSVLLRRNFNNKRSELVRSAIDVLDLLPDSAFSVHNSQPKEKSESFFIRIKDDNCDCEKENIVVADHMPEKIKQRLYRRHRKRELRMECARRGKAKQLKREIEKQRNRDLYRSKKEIEKECMAIINALIDDVIAKIAQDEYKFMRIKQKSNKMSVTKSDDNISGRNRKRDVQLLINNNSHEATDGDTLRYCIKDKERKRSEKHRVCGKLSLQTHPHSSSSENGPKRIYQKSEIHEGNKCIEILEILEYVDSSQSSPETMNSDENHNHSSKSKKSRIPVPVYERIQRIPKLNSQRNAKNEICWRSSLPVFDENNDRSSRLLGGMLLDALTDNNNGGRRATDRLGGGEAAARRASLPEETRSRSNSLRFKRVFDIIPEERSSLSIESSNEDINYNRRISAPTLYEDRREKRPTLKAINGCESHERKFSKGPEDATKDAATSPIQDSDDKKMQTAKSKSTMTSPNRKSAATSPVPSMSPPGGARRTLATHGWLGTNRADRSPPNEGSKERAVESDKLCERKSVTTQYEPSGAHRTVRTIQGEKTEPIIVGGTRGRRTPPDDARRRDLRRKKTDRTKLESHECTVTEATQSKAPGDPDVLVRKMDKHKIKTISVEKSEEETLRLPEFAAGRARSSSDSDSGGSLLCALAPKWLAHARHKRGARVARRDPVPPVAPVTSPDSTAPAPPGGWSVTVAGSCRAALPADVEMRLRFPESTQHGAGGDSRPQRDPRVSHSLQACQCRHCAACTCPGAHPPLPPTPAHDTRLTNQRKLTLTMKKEALDSSILASKSTKKSIDALPELEAYRASRTKTKSSVKMRRACSLHCWLPADEPAPLRASDELSVLGCAIVPELKPRVPTMSERDLTRAYTPRHYLRS